MKNYEIVAKVTGDIYISTTIIVDKGKMKFSFIPDDSKKLKEIIACIEIPENNNMFEPRFFKDEKGLFNIVINSDEEIYTELISELQAIESHLSFKSLGSLESINWEYPVKKSYGQNESDFKDSSRAFSVMYEENNISIPVKVSEQVIKNIVKDAREFDELNFDLAFWRIGINFLKKGLYKLAYIHFYFIIENLYSNCKFTEKKLLEEFNKSTELSQITKQSYHKIINDPKLKKGLSDIYKKYNIEQNLENLLLLLIRIRNDLQHYHKNNPNSRNTPFIQTDYKSIALLVQTVSFIALFVNLGKINNIKKTSL